MTKPKKHIIGLSRTPPSFEDRAGKVYRFDRNEKTTPFPEKHLRKILENIHPDEMIAYPELEPLYQKLAKWLNIDRSELLITSGSDTGIKAVYEVYVEDGDEIIILSPTYGMYYVYGRMFGATTKEVFYDDDLSLPVGRLLELINEKTKLVAIANPNLTGTVIFDHDLIKVIEESKKVNALVLLDEAYYHFYNGTMISFINKYDNLIILRTFSKGFGIAPLRVGYVASNKEIIDQLYKVKLTHEITVFGKKFGSYLLENLEILNDYVDQVFKAKEVLYDRLPKIEFEVLKSHANFVFFKPPSNINSKQLMARLEEKRIFIKGPFTKKPFSGHLRVTVGTQDQMNMFCDEIENILKTQTSVAESRG